MTRTRYFDETRNNSNLGIEPTSFGQTITANSSGYTSHYRKWFRTYEDIYRYYWNLSGGGGNDIITGAHYSDTLYGDGGNDDLYGGGGDDFLYGGGDDDTLYGGTGNNYLDGGEGNNDTANYSDLTQSITLSPFGVVKKADGTQDQLFQIENIIAGFSTIDTIDCSSNQNFFSQNFKIEADLETGIFTVKFPPTSTNPTPPELNFNFKNFDNIIGSNGDDTLTGSSFNNQLYGGDGNDDIKGGKGNDLLNGGLGNNTLNGGDDYDTADYSNLPGDASRVGITLLPEGKVKKAVDGTEDTLINIEKIVAGVSTIDTIDCSKASQGTTINANLEGTLRVYISNPNPLNFEILNFDHVIGTKGDDTLTGSNLNNKLNGGEGKDTLTGGGGQDTLTGGIGEDRFVFNSFTEGNDFIMDFTGGQGGDKLQISKSGFGVEGFDPNDWNYNDATKQLSFVRRDYRDRDYVDYGYFDYGMGLWGLGFDQPRVPNDIVPNINNRIATFDGSSNFSLTDTNFVFV
jgi:Ca2+-binding RTX toxin-like protein